MPEVLALSSDADPEPDLTTFDNKSGLADDMKFLASMPELCDVTFLVGETREPVCAVKVSSFEKCFDTFKKFSKKSKFQGCIGCQISNFSKDVVPTTTSKTRTSTHQRKQVASVFEKVIRATSKPSKRGPKG